MGTDSKDKAADMAKAVADSVTQLNHRTIPGMMADAGHAICAAVLPASLCAAPTPRVAPKKPPSR